MKHAIITALFGLSLVFSVSASCAIDKPQSDLSVEPAVDYCEVIRRPDIFEGKVIKIHATYQVDFEEAVITGSSCSMPLKTWVDFDENWEHQTKKQVRDVINNQKWRSPLDVVFVGIFKTDGHYGHMDMYPTLFQVFSVQSASLPAKQP